eukprot:scaffold1247_cov251-Pinguiococcus_pyrenoidosus.AAC.18
MAFAAASRRTGGVESVGAAPTTRWDANATTGWLRTFRGSGHSWKASHGRDFCVHGESAGPGEKVAFALAASSWCIRSLRKGGSQRREWRLESSPRRCGSSQGPSAASSGGMAVDGFGFEAIRLTLWSCF